MSMNGLKKIPCTVEILTLNSESTLENCLESVKDFVDILVLDGNSTDRTREIALKYGARILKQYDTDEPAVRIHDFSEVRNKGLREAKFDWFMFIDADEYLSPEAVAEIRGIVENPQPEAYVWWQPREYVLDGKIIDCATTYPNRQIRLFHRAHVTEFVKPIHERIHILSGEKVSTLQNFEYLPIESLGELKERWKRYIDHEIELVTKKGRRKIARAIGRNFALFCFYTFRYIRNRLFYRGRHMPFFYEWARHSYLLSAGFRLIPKFLNGK